MKVHYKGREDKGHYIVRRFLPFTPNGKLFLVDCNKLGMYIVILAQSIKHVYI